MWSGQFKYYCVLYLIFLFLRIGLILSMLGKRDVIGTKMVDWILDFKTKNKTLILINLFQSNQYKYSENRRWWSEIQFLLDKDHPMS